MVPTLYILLVLSIFLCPLALAATADDWRGRTIYQVFTDRFARTDGSTTAACNVNNNDYCGGTWRGLVNKLDYIQDMGFTAIWISPITLNIERGYHGYWQTDLYSVNSNFGTAQDLKDLSSALHNKGMYLMVDIVTNHMGSAGAADSVDDNQMNPFNAATYYHTYCNISDWQDQSMVELCWLGDPDTVLMPDLKTEEDDVRAMFSSWISQIVSDYSIDGLRIDSVKNVEIGFWSSFCAAAGILCFGEVSDGNYAYTYPYSQYLDAITDYPMYYSITRVFQQQTDMSDIAYNLGLCKDGGSTGCKDTTMAFSFIENHDNARFPAGNKDLALAKNAIAYTMLGDGVPIVYQGQEFHLAGGDDPGCREAIWLQAYNTDADLYKHIALLNQIRNTAMRAAPASGYPSYSQYQSWVLTYSANVIQMRKDPVRTILSNEGSSAASYTLTTSGMGFTTGANVVEILSCDVYVADSTGDVTLNMGQGAPNVLMSEAEMSGTGLCGH